MTTILVSGWNTGFTKVQFTFNLQRELGYRLREAKLATDAVMDDQVVELAVSGDPEPLLQAMRQLGAICDVVVPVG